MDFHDRMVDAMERPKTMRQAKAILKPLGLWISIRHGEYRVAFPNDETSAYYTNDLDDAIGTGIAMSKTRRKDWKL